MKTLSEIKKEAESHKGMKFTASSFKSAFKTGDMSLLNNLISDSIVVVCGQNKRGLNIYQIA